VAAPVMDSAQVGAFSSEKLPFTVRFGDAANDYRVMAMFVLPGDVVPVSVESPASAFELRPSAGMAVANGATAWTWKAPSKPGLYPIDIQETASGRDMRLNVFVMVPYSAMRAGSIGGYRIGSYPAPRSDFYQRPRGFVQVTPELMDVEVAPHFRLGQFVCKEPGGPPEYLVLRQPLLVKLEEVLAEVNLRGRDAHGFSLLSAYRTPVYNTAIGNETTFSRHHYGDAADVFVDEDHDGRMDDLNRDGRHDLGDARWLGSVVDDVVRRSDDLTGGLGTYEPTPTHGAFVHMDVRGFHARWGA